MAKKPTARQLEERIDSAITQLNFTSRMLESIGIAFSNYVQFKGEEEEFKNYLENNKNLHKLTKEEDEERVRGSYKEDNEVPTPEIRKESNGEK